MNRTRAAAALTLIALRGFVLLNYGPTSARIRNARRFAGMLGRMFNMFGGKRAREGATSIVAVKGDRKATLNDSTGQIIDLAEEKVYDLDLKKKTYKVTTFAELRRQMEEAQEEGEEDARRSSQRGEGKAARPPSPTEQVEVDFDVKDTGEKKTINGFDTHQTVMTITVREKGKTLEQSGGMVMTTDMWLTPKIPAMKEIAAFDMKLREEALRHDVRRGVCRADGRRDGDVPDDEGGAR